MIQDRSPHRTALLAATLFVFVATDAAAQQLPPGHVPVSASGGQAAPGTVVLETMNSAGYTYVRGALQGKETWFAGPLTALAVGDTVQVASPMRMQNFASGSLGRTFEVLYFVSGYRKEGAAPSPPRSGVSDRSGEVREVLVSGGYTYVRVETGDASLWVAGPPTDVDEGDTVSWGAGTLMRRFSSRTLGRTFDEIVFVEEFVVAR